MKLRWSFRAANDRGPQAESRIPGESPAKRCLSKDRYLFILHMKLNGDSKDERYRATVRWTVVTASDQAPAGARVESPVSHRQKGTYREIGAFLFFNYL